MRQFFKNQSPPSRAEEVGTAHPLPDPDHAWKALALVNEWIRHADAKAGVTLAFVGVLSSMTFNLVRSAESQTALFDVIVVCSCALLVVTGGLAGWTLTPRVNDKDATSDAINRLFYASISAHYRSQREQYAEVLNSLTSDPVELTRDLAHQVHANAQIATTKARYTKWAIRAALASGVAVAALAIIVGTTNG